MRKGNWLIKEGEAFPLEDVDMSKELLTAYFRKQVLVIYSSEKGTHVVFPEDLKIEED